MERNMVSLEEALEVTDKKSLRTLMLNVIRGDYQNSLASINLALNSEDSETAHYAASILQDVLNDFRSKVQEKYLLCQEENEEQVENCVKLVEYMNPHPGTAGTYRPGTAFHDTEKCRKYLKKPGLLIR